MSVPVCGWSGGDVLRVSIVQQGQWREMVREYRNDVHLREKGESKIITARWFIPRFRGAERLSWARWPEAGANATSPAIIFPWPKATIPRGTK
jgi:hypothetical protein